jgi:PAS domain S-box-containing protein
MSEANPIGAHEAVNILMVDDQPGKLLSYEAILGPLGENLLKANSGREALEHLLKTDVAVVLMDVSMPDIDGFQLAEMIREHPRFRKTAIIFISGVHLTDTDRLKGYERGAVDYISVPIIPDLLRAKVSVFAELHRKNRQLEKLNRELEQRVAERTEELRESESQFRSLANSIPQLAWMADANGGIFWFNQRWYEYTGTTIEQVKGSGWKTLHSPEHLERVTNKFNRSVETGQDWEDTFPLCGKDGRYRWFLSRAVPIRDVNGKVARWFGTNTDITDRMLNEQALSEQARLLDLTSDAIFIWSADDQILYWNSGATKMYGYSREEANGMSIHKLLRTKFPEPLDAINTKFQHSGSWAGQLVHTRKDGSEVVVDSRWVLDPSSSEGSFTVMQTNTDITDRKRAEEALVKSERLAAMGRLAGIIAHEINNPLEAISNAFYLLHDHPSLDEEARYYSRLAEEELARIVHITRQTLSFYRESQQPMALSLSEILDNVVELQSRKLQLNRIILKKNFRTAGTIHGFSVELKQVFLNIITNAAQAMPDGGELRLDLTESRDWKSGQTGLRVNISDTGVGIDARNSKKIFEPFFSTKEAKGTGLGLWISRGIIQKYGGSIRFRTMRFKTGNVTCFSVFIPGNAATESTNLASALSA